MAKKRAFIGLCLLVAAAIAIAVVGTGDTKVITAVAASSSLILGGFGFLVWAWMCRNENRKD